MSYDYWQTQFGGRSDVLGTKLKIDDLVYTVIGVAPPGFAGVSDRKDPVAFVPITAYAASVHEDFYKDYNWGWLETMIRRKPGVSEAQAAADLTNAYRQSWLRQRAIDPGNAAARGRAATHCPWDRRSSHAARTQVRSGVCSPGSVALR